MNLPLTGLVWRTVLRAVPKVSRPDVLGTLSEFYGPKAPFSEAFRTFTSGSRMNNRANTSSPIDLWREAARNALVFHMMLFGTVILGGLLPFSRLVYPNGTTIQRTSTATASIIVGFCLQRGRNLRASGGILLSLACVTILKPGSQNSSPNSVSLSIRVAIALFVALVGATLLSRRLSSKQRLALGVTSIVLSAALYAWSEGPFDSELSRLQLFATVQMSLVSSAIVGWVSETKTKTNITKKVWWPSAVALGVGLWAVLSWSDRLSGPVFAPAAKLVPALLICLVVFGLVFVTVRPQLFLTIGWVYVLFGMQKLPFVSFQTSEWTLNTATPFVVAALAMTIAITGSKRSLRC